MNIKLCTFNVRGIGNTLKRKQMFQWLKIQNYDIYLLQETHSILRTADTWKADWGRGDIVQRK